MARNVSNRFPLGGGTAGSRSASQNLAAVLVRRQVAIIFARGRQRPTAQAAKAAT